MFNLKEFIKKGLVDAVGKMADYQVILNAAGWHEKGVLDEADLAHIGGCIDAKNAAGEEAPAGEEEAQWQ
jgi:hypothetical protein